MALIRAQHRHTMSILLQLQNSVSVTRKELRNLRKQVQSLKYMLKNEMLSIRRNMSSFSNQSTHELDSLVSDPPERDFAGATSLACPSKKSETFSPLISSLSSAAIGIIRTCFREKNGTPRQPGLCPNATGSIQIEAFTNPSHSLEGLEDYSHAWLLFVFHQNKQDNVKPKVKPPRLGGQKRGVFATRSPHRPCPVGLSLVRVDRVAGSTVYVSGVDLVDGTPILDIKPYIPAYDNPVMHLDGMHSSSTSVSGKDACQIGVMNSLVRVAPWLESPPVTSLVVEFTRDAEQQLSLFQCKDQPSCNSGNTEECTSQIQGEEPSGSYTTGASCREPPYLLQTFSSLRDARQAIVAVLQQDPRSVYRRDKCSQEPYKFSIDNLNITSRFMGEKAVVTDIQPKALWRCGEL